MLTILLNILKWKKRGVVKTVSPIFWNLNSTKVMQLLRNEAIFKENLPKETREIHG